LGRALPFAGTPLLYLLASHAFFLLWIVAVMALARRLGGLAAALAAGGFLAVSPRFLAAFSLNNVGQYAEVNALGAAGLAVLGSTGGPLLAGFLVGLALWQQLVAVYFVAVLALAVLVTPRWRSPRPLAELVLGLAAGSYPIWLWNAAHGWATFDFFRRGGKNPWERLAGVPDRLERTVSISFPKLFGLSDLDVAGTAATVLGLALPVLVIAMTCARRRDLLRDRGRSVVFVAASLFAVTLAVFVVSKFSHRGVQRPRYLIPLYTPVAIAVGWSAAALARRSRPLAATAVGGVLLVNAAGLVPWLRARADAEARDDAFLGRLADLGVRTGYSGFWVGPKYTFLSEGAVVLSGELGPVVSWVHPAHAAVVRERGPDALVAGRGALADALAGRLSALGVAYEREDVAGHTVFHGLSRRVTLEDVSGYDTDAGPPPTASGDTPDSRVGEESDTTS
jgi:MFS family permease